MMRKEEKLKMRRTVIWRPKVEEDSLKQPSTFGKCRADGVFQSYAEMGAPGSPILMKRERQLVGPGAEGLVSALKIDDY